MNLLVVVVFLTFNVLVIDPKNYFSLHGDQPRLWCADQRKISEMIKSGVVPPPSGAAVSEGKNQTKANTSCVQREHMSRRAPRDASSTYPGATQVLVSLVLVHDSFGSSTKPTGVAPQALRFRVRSQLS